MLMSEQANGVLSYWNLKAYKEGKERHSIFELPLYSDAHITGELKSQKGPCNLINMIAGIRQPGSVADVMILRMFWHLNNQPTYGVKTDSTRYHGGWASDEIAALISLKLGIRVKAGEITRTYDSHINDPLGTPRSV